MSFYINAIKFISLALCSFLLATILPSCLSVTSRTVGTNVVYPADANLVNVQDYGAKGDGITNDTAAIRQAVQNNLTKHRTLFFPAGTYLVSDTIEWKDKDGVFGAFLTWQGEGIDKTIIRLKDKTSGFDNPQQPKAIARSGSLGVGGNGSGNRAHNNYIFDMTFDVGKGNPGAIGVDFNASNTGAMENVAIVSRDGQGTVGLDLTREVGPCLIKNLIVKGFDIGIRGGSALYNVALENIYLENQNKVGIENKDLVLAIRKLTSVNSVPAINNGGDWTGPIVVVDSELRGGSSAAVAIENNSNIFVRNLRVEGYKAAIQNGDKLIEGPKVEEFVYPQTLELFNSPDKSLNLSVEETPEFIDNNLDNWANVRDFGAIPEDDLDDSAAIQEAINSGKTTIYFPFGGYKLDKPVIVHGNVRRIMGFHSWIHNPGVAFRFENKEHPVILERLNFDGGGGGLEHAASQPVVVRHSIGPRLLTTPEASTWFIDNVVAVPVNIGEGQKVYARQLNCEMPPPDPMIVNDGGLVWLLGYKTEFGNTVAVTRNGGQTEILGGLFYPAQGVNDPQLPLLINQDASLAAVYREIAFGSTYKIQVKETRQQETKTLLRDTLGQGNMIAVPLYVGYESFR
jgi:hypothetical protein